ncbi:MAG: DUF721 domain-containing protein [Brumimicrobium sp.]|nr:DUF721 domain-containing protein [Brumimicrobium sp.]MCO5268410.1 DUF721 domain-containing protein [Brumimicrobium sp.]
MNEKERFQEDTNLEKIISKMFKAWGLAPKMKELDVVAAWPELMGKGVAHRTQEIYIRNKILHLKMNSSVMRDELVYGRSVIIQRINEYAGEEVIVDVWFE